MSMGGAIGARRITKGQKMNVTESFSINGQKTVSKYGYGTPAIVFLFDTGHRYDRYADGRESFRSAGRRGHLLNEKRGQGVKLIPKMRALAAARLS